MEYEEMSEEQKITVGLKILRKILYNYNGKLRNGEIPRAFPEYGYHFVTRILTFMEQRGWCYSYSDTWYDWYIVR